MSLLNLKAINLKSDIAITIYIIKATFWTNQIITLWTKLPQPNKIDKLSYNPIIIK